MRYSVALPNDRVDQPDDFLTAAAVADIASSVEDAGFDACFVTDHPFGSDRWLAAGGHHALDPLVELSFAAAATTRLGLHTNIYVLPYRNPFLAAKSVLSLDVLAGGRVILGVGAGYVGSEFDALGVDFDERNDLLEEGIEAMKLAWTQDCVVLQGRHFRARGNTMLPRPSSRPHPPVWMGGNSKRAITRAARSCQGWSPLPTTANRAPRTASVSNLEELRQRIALLHKEVEAIGRTEPLDICLSLLQPSPGSADYEPQHTRAYIRALEDVGVTWVGVRPVAGRSRKSYLDQARRFADDVMAALR
ncbi:TIGR03619 family F420-dependent LLM class oxidoreductase [Mycobacterium sp. CVI_P3]|uniref:TIGR03619 family F420-dependent LLM class oxidoreductase n=1 Tax=Mycobacterium pinniadriaticum TaxID=2994102 RepID=A0ABT3SH31_9MYCO|nr:TIGR03619 family F420-dependent LLM class oxidoreductase [Mycobacterium pinniadriaticum]MCX2931743.1 TIGR03619 family F420-dependent LLM class oxidoreductase [Mycobacterium pinniadriaticum]MCX2938182.1 TIGR03619 family F420-dependent LLM class oxidoreductase [Mycobacterium pinniadriaticum]